MRTKAIFNWIKERHAVYTRRQEGLPKPWSKDPIFQSYRFCNVYRELDTVTQWIATNWRQPNTNDPDVWFAMAVARLVNWPPTLAKLGYPVPWKPGNFVRVIDALVADHQKAFTGVYMIPAGPQKMSKAFYLTEGILTPMWESRGYAYTHTTSLAAFHKYLTGFNGIGDFLAGQIICDTKYTRLMDTSLDWWTWVSRPRITAWLESGVQSSVQPEVAEARMVRPPSGAQGRHRPADVRRSNEASPRTRPPELSV